MFWKRWLYVAGAVAVLVVALSCGDDDPITPIDLDGSDGEGAGNPDAIPAEWAGVWDFTATITYLGDDAGKRAEEPVEYAVDLCKDEEFLVPLRINGGRHLISMSFLERDASGRVIREVTNQTDIDGLETTTVTEYPNFDMFGRETGLLFPTEDSPCNPLFEADVRGLVLGDQGVYTVTVSVIPQGPPNCGPHGDLPETHDQDASVFGGGGAITVTNSYLDWPGEQLDGADGTSPGRPLWRGVFEGTRRIGDLPICGDFDGDGVDDIGGFDGDSDLDHPSNNIIWGDWALVVGNNPIGGGDHSDGFTPGVHVTVTNHIGHSGPFTLTLHDHGGQSAGWGHDSGTFTSTLHGDGSSGTYTHTTGSQQDVVHDFSWPVTVTVHAGDAVLSLTRHSDDWTWNHSGGNDNHR